MPPDNPQPALRSLADGWLNYSLDKSTGLYSKTNQSTVTLATTSSTSWPMLVVTCSLSRMRRERG
jgi:hypothetical protein